MGRRNKKRLKPPQSLPNAPASPLPAAKPIVAHDAAGSLDNSATALGSSQSNGVLEDRLLRLKVRQAALELRNSRTSREWAKPTNLIAFFALLTTFVTSAAGLWLQQSFSATALRQAQLDAREEKVDSKEAVAKAEERAKLAETKLATTMNQAKLADEARAKAVAEAAAKQQEVEKLSKRVEQVNDDIQAKQKEVEGLDEMSQLAAKLKGEIAELQGKRVQLQGELKTATEAATRSPPRQVGVISGTVRNLDGSPVANVRVSLVSTASSSTLQQTVSDQSGHFSIVAPAAFPFADVLFISNGSPRAAIRHIYSLEGATFDVVLLESL